GGRGGRGGGAAGTPPAAVPEPAAGQGGSARCRRSPRRRPSRSATATGRARRRAPEAAGWAKPSAELSKLCRRWCAEFEIRPSWELHGANFEFESTPEIMESRVVVDLKFPTAPPTQVMGTSNPQPHGAAGIADAPVFAPIV